MFVKKWQQLAAQIMHEIGTIGLAGKVFQLTTFGMSTVNWALYDSSFEFVFSPEHVSSVNPVLAEFISPKVSRLRRLDRTCLRYCFGSLSSSPAESRQTFDALIDCAKTGGQLHLDNLKFSTLTNIAKELENDEILSFMLGMIDVTNLSLTKALDILRVGGGASSLGANLFTGVADLVASKFDEVDVNELSELGLPMVEALLSNQHLQVSDEDSLYRTIRALIEIDLSFSALLSFVCFEYLSEDSIRDVTYFIGANLLDAISGTLWSRITQRLLLTPSVSGGRGPTSSAISPSTPDPKQADMARILCKSSPLDGIIAYLTKQCGNNVHDMDIVICDSDDCYKRQQKYHAKYAADFNTETYFKSNNNENAWICYDFKDHRVSISSYTLRSSPDGQDNLQSWILEVSDDKFSWRMLDKKTEDRHLRGRLMTHTFHVKGENPRVYSRYVRIRQTGHSFNSDNTYYFTLSAFELFGSIQ